MDPNPGQEFGECHILVTKMMYYTNSVLLHQCILRPFEVC